MRTQKADTQSRRNNMAIQPNNLKVKMMDELIQKHFANQAKIISLLEVIAAGQGLAASGEATETTKKDTKGSASKGGKSKETKADAPAKPKHTKDEVVAAIMSVKDAFGAPACKEITGKYGYKKIIEAQEEHFDAIVADCQALLDSKQDEEEEEV